MQRCIDLAKQSAGNVAPNPMVGSVLVHSGRIIGEGRHEYYGGPHAEVNCLNSVKDADKHLIQSSRLFVSLEPCAHFGKTPPCADLIIQNNIKNVVVGCRDPFVEVDGKGIEKLKAAGIDVHVGISEKECKHLNRRFFTFHTQHRPYIILKWAQSRNKKISGMPGLHERLMISNDYTNRVVHKWRREEASILVGKNTVLHDDPALTNRYWPGPSPVRLVMDMDLSLPAGLKMFTDAQSYTIVFNTRQHELDEALLQKRSAGVGFYHVTHDVSLVQQISNALYQLKIQSVLVEGGARLLQSFIDENVWDEARVITNEELVVDGGLSSPDLKNADLVNEETVMSDQIHYFVNRSLSTNIL